MERRGIDISHWQGIVDFDKVKASGIDFVIIKAGGSDAGLYKDSKFGINYTNAKAAGLGVGAYYFVGKNFTSAVDGKADAYRFAELLAGKKFDYPVYLDLEATSPADKYGATEAAIEFCKTMEDFGYYVGIYASDISGFVDRLDLPRLNAYDKWVARYESSPQVVKQYGMWQHSSRGVVPGIKGNVDLDVAYLDYPNIIISRHFNNY